MPVGLSTACGKRTRTRTIRWPWRSWSTSWDRSTSKWTTLMQWTSSMWVSMSHCVLQINISSIKTNWKASISGWLVVLSCCIAMWQVQFRFPGGPRDRALLRPADAPRGGRCDLWELRWNGRSDERQRPAELPVESAEGAGNHGGRSQADWKIRGGWDRWG